MIFKIAYSVLLKFCFFISKHSGKSGAFYQHIHELADNISWVKVQTFINPELRNSNL